MKRCPVCEFIYEDEQKLCDMDNMELVALPPEQSASFESTKAPRQKRRRKLALLALTAILCSVLGFQYYKGELAFGFSGRSQAAVESYDVPATPVRIDVQAQPVASPLPSASPSSAPSSPSKSPEKVARPEAVPKESAPIKEAPAVSVNVKRAPAGNSSVTAPNPKAKTPPKDEDKVSSILKKTANVLKKPFKL